VPIGDKLKWKWLKIAKLFQSLNLLVVEINALKSMHHFDKKSHWGINQDLMMISNSQFHQFPIWIMSSNTIRLEGVHASTPNKKEQGQCICMKGRWSSAWDEESQWL
jgi:hypothetical protein